MKVLRTLFEATVLVTLGLVLPLAAKGQETSVLICVDESSCAVQAKTLIEFRKQGGLGTCGVIPGEYPLKVVDRSGKLVGYRCEFNPYRPGL